MNIYINNKKKNITDCTSLELKSTLKIIWTTFYRTKDKNKRAFHSNNATKIKEELTSRG